MGNSLKAVIAGCGGIAGAWLPTIKEMPEVEMVGYVDIDPDAAARRKSEYGPDGAIASADLEKALAETKPDIVLDCTIPEAHINVTLAALRSGCHVLGEKPLADSMENAREMVKAARDAGKIYAVIQNRRYDPRIRAMREFIDSGRLGAITTLNSDFYIGAHFGGFRDRMEHVLLLDMAIHTFDAARFISGADPVAVYCKEWNPKGSWYDHDASAVAIFEMTGGVIYTYRGSWCAEGLNTTWECDWRGIGEKGTVVWDGADAFKAQTVNNQAGFLSEMQDLDVPIPANAKKGGHDGIIREFIDCVINGGTPETVCTDNIKSLAMVFGAIESAETGRRIEIEI